MDGKKRLTITSEEYNLQPELFVGLTRYGFGVSVEKDGQQVIYLSACIVGDDICPCCEQLSQPVDGWQCPYCLEHKEIGDYKSHYLYCQTQFRRTFYSLADFLKGKQT